MCTNQGRYNVGNHPSTFPIQSCPRFQMLHVLLFLDLVLEEMWKGKDRHPNKRRNVSFISHETKTLLTVFHPFKLPQSARSSWAFHHQQVGLSSELKPCKSNHVMGLEVFSCRAPVKLSGQIIFAWTRNHFCRTNTHYVITLKKRFFPICIAALGNFPQVPLLSHLQVTWCMVL